MKNKILLPICIFVSSFLIVLGQPSPNTDTVIYTPRNSPVNAVYYLGDDYTPYEADSIDNYYLANYPGSILIESSSRRYNCHGYAWELIEDGLPVWLDGYSDLGPYWTDNSYVEVASIQNATKIGFQVYQQPGKMDHSAVPGNHPDTTISKWANGPLMKHYINSSPWPGSSYVLKYYKLKIDNITGPSLICDQSTYSISYLTPTTWIDWESSTLLDIYWNGKGHSATAEPNTYTEYGYSEYINANVKTIYEGIDEGADVSIDIDTRSKYNLHVSNTPSNVQIHVPVEPIIGEVEAMVWVSSDPGNEAYNWQVGGGTIVEDNGDEIILIADCPSRTGLNIQVQAINNCGKSSWVYRHVDVDCSSGGINPLSLPLPPFSLSPNPADDYVEIDLTQYYEESPGVKANIKYEVRIYNTVHILLYDQKSGNPVLRINTSDFEEGIYFVYLIIGDEVFVKQLVISH